MIEILGFLALSSIPQVSPDIPPDHPIYEEIETLSGNGCLAGDLNAIRPITESQLAQLVERARNCGPSRGVVESYLKRWGYLSEENVEGFVYGELRGQALATNAESRPYPRVDASFNPLLKNQQGRWSRGGVWTSIEPRLVLRWKGWGSFDLTPRFPLGWSNEGGGGEISPELYETQLKLGHGGFETAIGRFPIRWGHGRSGSLIFGGMQKPLAQVRVGNATPVTLPGFMKYIGPVQFSVLGARLDGDQVYPHSYLVAERLGIRPMEELEFGFAQTIILGGDGAPGLSAKDATLEILGTRQGDITKENLSNRNFLADFRAVFPPLHRTEIYGEFFFEDCCGGNWSRDLSTLVGIHLPNIGNKRPLDLWVEWVRTTEITYRNGVFSSGYEDRHHLLGHPIGPGGFGLYFMHRVRWSDSISYAGEEVFERRRRDLDSQGSSAVDEDRIRYLGGPTLRLGTDRHPWWLRGRLGYEVVKNEGNVSDRNRHNVLGQIEAGTNF